MTNDAIAKFCETQNVPANNCIRIDFKKRNPILGLFVEANDYEELKSKNFWRIVMRANIDEWKRTKNIEMAKIYSGSEIVKLSFTANKALV
ncbi:MAG TPA: short-chain dehydrogenase [Panacibacter sp.]|nr:short-chain dehydrogenase [Panacibacter sp.]HNP43492.1 short-chain dehydrogenase [Panacibacter sp.]